MCTDLSEEEIFVNKHGFWVSVVSQIIDYMRAGKGNKIDSPINKVSRMSEIFSYISTNISICLLTVPSIGSEWGGDRRKAEGEGGWIRRDFIAESIIDFLFEQEWLYTNSNQLCQWILRKKRKEMF